MVLTEIATAAIRTTTPVHVRAHHHGPGAAGVVIGVHIDAMHLPSLVTGRSSTASAGPRWRWGRGTTLLLAGPAAALAPGDSLGLVEHFGPFGPVFAMDRPSSSVVTQAELDWRPEHPSLLEDLELVRS